MRLGKRKGQNNFQQRIEELRTKTLEIISPEMKHMRGRIVQMYFKTKLVLGRILDSVNIVDYNHCQ